MPLLPESSSYTDFGGTKTDYSEVVDSSTDRSAAEVNGALCDVAMMSRTALRGWVRFNMGASPTLVSASSWDTSWRSNTTTSPVLASTGGGVYTITLPSTVLDEQGTTHTVSIKSCMASLEGGDFGFYIVSATSANVITFSTADTSGAPHDISGIATVWFI